MKSVIHSFIRPKRCPMCHRPYKVDKLGRCVYCGAFLGLLDF